MGIAGSETYSPAACKRLPLCSMKGILLITWCSIVQDDMKIKRRLQRHALALGVHACIAHKALNAIDDNHFLLPSITSLHIPCKKKEKKIPPDALHFFRSKTSKHPVLFLPTRNIVILLQLAGND